MMLKFFIKSFISIFILCSTCLADDTGVVVKTFESNELQGEVFIVPGEPPFPRYNPLPSRDGNCSLDRLRKIMHKSMTDNVRETKQNIHTNMGNMDGGSWAIICAECNFSYMAHAQEYCIHSRYNITCLVFRQD
ncbi:unnamed protein product [Auanema sp. JU1783]|nr:unnamed protein product [Auanema sp. JU1783]